MADEADRDEWYKQHRFCPKCGSAKIEQTCMGFVGVVDSNYARCPNCYWTGRVYELVGEPAQDAPESP